MKNLHKFYYKDYFPREITNTNLNTDSNQSLIIEKNKILCSSIDGYQNPIPDNPLINKTKILKILYPGLVTGIGINHETGITFEFKLGMHFDWTYGVPIIYGSSVKGVLKSWFRDTYNTSVKKYYSCGIDDYDLMMDIFSGAVRDIATEHERYPNDWEEKVKVESNRIYTYKSIYQRDIFFDAVIEKPDSQGRILCSDAITSHGDDPFKEPTPIPFLKIAPGCTIKFRFKLEKSTINGIEFSVDKKMELFTEILTTYGIGAKTSVGYGQLSLEDDDQSSSNKDNDKLPFLTITDGSNFEGNMKTNENEDSQVPKQKDIPKQEDIRVVKVQKIKGVGYQVFVDNKWIPLSITDSDIKMMKKSTSLIKIIMRNKTACFRAIVDTN